MKKIKDLHSVYLKVTTIKIKQNIQDKTQGMCIENLLRNSHETKQINGIVKFN